MIAASWEALLTYFLAGMAIGVILYGLTRRRER